jgi:hypothetical protein
MQYKIENVEAMWPRINRTYKFDSNERKSVPCDVKDPLAAYEMSFRINKDQVKVLWAEMCKAYKSKADPSWPEKPVNPFKADDDYYIGKVKLKGSYNGELTKKPKQYDAKGKLLPDDFMLTSASMVNIAVTFVPYNVRGAGVSLRLRAVQVLHYSEPEEQNPFSEVEGYAGIAEANDFETAAPKVSSKQNISIAKEDPFGDGVASNNDAKQNMEEFDDEIPF